MERDLEPGNLTVPEISLMGCKTISGTADGFSAVATEAKTFNGVLAFVKIDSLFEARKYFGELLMTFDPKIKECGEALRTWGLDRFGVVK